MKNVAKHPCSAQMMRWTPPGDLNGIEVPKSSRSSIKTIAGGIQREEYNHRN
jgi:hypothetical protein